MTAAPSGSSGSRAAAPFAVNAWYVAGFSTEIDAGALVGRKIVGLPVLLFRQVDGRPAAIGNRCPHRFAPLSMGTLCGNSVRCAYHGLAFDASGRCVHNPHGSGALPASLSVPAYPVEERCGLLWVWPGDPASADRTTIPAYDGLNPAGFHIGFGYIHGRANYELMSDNILDLSHIEFLHPSLGTPEVSRAKVEVTQGDGTVTTTRHMKDEMLPEGIARVYRVGGRRVNRSLRVTWYAPANLVLTVTVDTADDAEPWQSGSQTLHLFTPETTSSSHYFFVASVARDRVDAETASLFFANLQRVFTTEDKPMIDAQQAMIGDADLSDLKPALLPVDKAAVLARRELARRIAAEQALPRAMP
ncbi:aromatic ring-hydroxylating dioxygenase subunit alpha [Sphingomonas sp. LB3N6]|uniref:aromatic ring-hydroxylating dioxygenase subunit alpha n=1 Tax=Sphingomonas fucosidasi TaxID=3096164 RepID=UPI002FCB2598